VFIESFRHKALRRLALEGRTAGLDGQLVVRLGKMLSFMVAATSFEKLTVPPNFGLHPLVGDRAGRWSMTVSRNWRLTFVKIDDVTIGDLDLEDYH
jgi:proteic killer suppression protein